MSSREEIRRARRALPFWVSLGTLPLAAIEAWYGGWSVLLLPTYAWWSVSVLDQILGRNEDQPDVETPEADLFWYRFITLIWFPVQFVAIFGMIWWVTHTNHLRGWDIFWIFFGMGVISGTIGIVYSHELFHQKNRLERLLGDLLLATVLYSHFRTEHLLVHHLWVGTPRDAVTARYNEGFHRFFWRVLFECPQSAWKAEALMLERAGRSRWHRSNPFWRYAVLQLAMLALAFALGGWAGVGLFALQAFFAVWQLELTNYVEHYGLTREYKGEGRYEHVLPRHSWNADHTASNWLLINLQRHSDHHYKPERRFPLLQTYSAEEAPQLPFGYPIMCAVALVPPLWRRRMNPRVQAWRKKYYPHIADWQAYKDGTTPLPRGSV